MITNPNEDIKKAIRAVDLKFWQVAAEIGYTDVTFSKKLRFPLSEDLKERIFKAIIELVDERMAGT